MRFFLASGCPIATTSLYRCVHLAEQLRALGHEAVIMDWSDETRIDPALAQNYDALFLYRLPMSERLARVIESARTAETPIIFDTDDLVFEPELVAAQRGVARLTPPEQAQHLAGVRRYLQTLQASDAVTTATPVLAEWAARRGKISFVHRNALGKQMLACANTLTARSKIGDDARVVIGYGSGTPTHDVDFAEAAPALAKILARFPSSELWIVGPVELPDAFSVLGGRVRRFPLTDWPEWFERASQFDIALAPLELDNVFCRAKSEIKFVEAGALGVPVVASRTEPFKNVITHGQDGMLATSESDWAEALSWLIEKPERREAMGALARASVMQRYTPEVRTLELVQLLPRLLAARKENAKPA